VIAIVGRRGAAGGRMEMKARDCVRTQNTTLVSIEESFRKTMAALAAKDRTGV